jgi:two-component system, NtrC family, response regulator HydG
LRVVEIAMPALRERREDIPRLAGHFLARIAARDGRRPLTLSRDAVKALLDYEFPGNVRELENLLEGAAALVSGDAIGAADLQFGIARGAAGTAGAGDDPKATGTSLRHVETAHIRRILAQVKGNKSRAAKLLGVSRRTLYRKRV